ncbi:hypothetical protein NL108_009112 [Boleophthalmus pectinirostris]|nr:hypothetical protein NL108_009112 [Boleophthalmus pectinirostris]
MFRRGRSSPGPCAAEARGVPVDPAAVLSSVLNPPSRSRGERREGDEEERRRRRRRLVLGWMDERGEGEEETERERREGDEVIGGEKCHEGKVIEPASYAATWWTDVIFPPIMLSSFSHRPLLSAL